MFKVEYHNYLCHPETCCHKDHKSWWLMKDDELYMKFDSKGEAENKLSELKDLYSKTEEENNMTKQYMSELGKLYQKQRDEEPLNSIVLDIYNSFEAFIKCYETLPIPVRDVYPELSEKELGLVLSSLKDLGCIVEHTIEKSPYGKKCFMLVDLL